MSKADILFKSMCEDIINNGTNTKGQEVRPIWPDTNEKAYTLKKFGVMNRYNLQEEFPAITFRKTGIKSAMDEILWIFQRKSNNIKDLKPHIWDEWADEKGSIGKAYGYQIAQPYIHHTGETGVETAKVAWDYQSAFVTKANYKKNDRLMNISMDQMDAVLYDLEHTPFSRRIMTNIWNFKDLHEMNLQPCCYSCTFNVVDNGSDKLVLNMLLNQRSNDVLAANNWNVVQYSILLMMIAQVSNMIPGELVHVIADAHIYDRHVPLVEELIKRPMYDAPKVRLNPEIKDFYKFTTDDIVIEDYQFGEQIKNIPIAV